MDARKGESVVVVDERKADRRRSPIMPPVGDDEAMRAWMRKRSQRDPDKLAAERELMEDDERFCDGCYRVVTPLPSYRMALGDLLFCAECAERPWPTSEEMGGFMMRAFGVMEAIARKLPESVRSQYEDFAHAVGHYVSAQPEHQLDGYLNDSWEVFAKAYHTLAFGPLRGRTPLPASGSVLT